MSSTGHDPATTGEPRPRLWATVLADLQTRLANGEFDDRFPTDKELMARYGVSRHTAREAVRRLDVVARRPRVGGRIRRPPGAVENLGVSLRALGVELALGEPSRRPRRSVRIAAAMGIAGREPMDVATHVLHADGQPLLVSELWRPAGTALADEDVRGLLGLGPLDPAVEVAAESVMPVVASDEIRAAMKLPAGAAVFCAEQLIVVDGRAAGWHEALIRPERYRCVVRWDPT